jgi:hypothetical protein
MAEAKNTFLQGKMNKDLDDRIIPNGEYRDALNIAVGKSESHNVGSLQNVLGNKKLTKPSDAGTVPFETNENLVCIGYFVDNETNRVFQFLTSYVDPNPSLNTLPTGQSAKMKITVYDPRNSGNPYLTLAEGWFLNFSTTNLITGVNLIEDLLFWTDNRNQPRKINVTKAISYPVESGDPYYTTVDQISVAKYAPFTAPVLYSKITGLSSTGTSTLIAGQTKIYIDATTLTASGLATGCQLILDSPIITAVDSAVVTNIIEEASGYPIAVYISGDYTIADGTDLIFYKSSMTSNTNDSGFAGDDNFLRDKFVRFSYRFRFDDNEYSLMAPFTQPIFVPNQKGFFTNGDEDAAYRSTVLEWMENSINQVNLLVELPDTGFNLSTSYKIKSMDILYKESDALVVKVVETISVAKIQEQIGEDSNIYSYIYKSQKPYKTLQPAETLRVYDKVPIRALAQEVSGNRVIYGNFINQYTPPSGLNYNITILEKDETFSSWIEYPNHTLKQNRTYQVGVVLGDKFGRESSVILSNTDVYTDVLGFIFGASSIYAPYKSNTWTTVVKDWLGDSLALIFNEPITSNRDETAGTPGLYATVSGSEAGSSNGFEVTAFSDDGNNQYQFEIVGTPAQSNYPAPNKYLRGKYKDYVKVITVDDSVNPIVVTTEAPISDIYIYNPSNVPDIKYSYELNELGWYSYKIVVKQQQQEYYNVYIPGMLAGYPVGQTFSMSAQQSKFPVGEEDVTCHFVAINDNINKVPRDLSEVGPNQRQYRSSVKLWCRVENALIPTGGPITTYATNKQYYPSASPDTVNTIAPTTDLNFLPNSNPENIDGSASFNLYQFETSPLICRVSTNNRVGVVGNTVIGVPPDYDIAMSPFLGVYETTPVVSLLDIFWETSSTGLISDLNTDILNGSDSIVTYSNLEFLFRENQNPTGTGHDTGAADSPYITEWFYFKNASGVIVTDLTMQNFSVVTRGGTNVTYGFQLIQDTDTLSSTYLWWRIKILVKDFYFGANVAIDGSYIFRFQIQHTVDSVTYNPLITTFADILQISNIIPIVTIPSIDNTPVFNLTSNPLVGPMADLVGKNGNTSPAGFISQADLWWDYDPLPGTPNNYYVYFSVVSPQGYISLNNINLDLIQPGNYDVRARLRDATTIDGIQTDGGLSAYRTVRLNRPNVSIGCGEWTSVSTETTTTGYYKNRLQGYINIWKMLRPGETIVLTGTDVVVKEWTQAYTNFSNILSGPNSGTLLNSVFFQNGSTSNFNGTFNFELFTNRPIFGGPGGSDYVQPAAKIRVEGTVRTSTGRNIPINFESTGSFATPPVGDYAMFRAMGCSTGSPVYLNSVCYDWYIHNVNSFPLPFSGFNGNNHEIIGGIVPANSYVGTTIGLATAGQTGTVYPRVKAGSLDMAGYVTSPQVFYVGSSILCPL